MDNIYIDRSLLVAFVKYILSQIYSHFFEQYSWILSEDCGNCCFLKKTFLKSSDIYFCYSKNINFHNSGMAGRRKLPDPSMNNIFGLKCCVTITPKGQTGRNCNSLFKLDSNWIISMEQKNKDIDWQLDKTDSWTRPLWVS